VKTLGKKQTKIQIQHITKQKKKFKQNDYMLLVQGSFSTALGSWPPLCAKVSVVLAAELKTLLSA